MGFDRIGHRGSYRDGSEDRRLHGRGERRLDRQPDNKGEIGRCCRHDEIMQARAQKMVSAGRSPIRKSTTKAMPVAWQGANRVEADRLDIDRERHVMEAHGKVVSQFVDKDKDDKSRDAKATNPEPGACRFHSGARAGSGLHGRNAARVYTREERFARPDA